ncbi:MAG TPA: hypothetical protein VGA78_02350, partial [Gemmatimonadales bacterium]
MVGGLLVAVAVFQGVNVAPVAGPRRTTALARAVSVAPKLDGRLDDAVWSEAVVLGDFVQREPDEGRPASEPTEVRVVYTGAALFIAVRAFDSLPDQIA